MKILCPLNVSLRRCGPFKRFARLLAAVPAALGLLSCAATPASDSAALAGPYHVEIRRTSLGIPHVKADDWGSLGYGYGYVQAQDNLCTMADGFVTYRGERSRYFGPQARPHLRSDLRTAATISTPISSSASSMTMPPSPVIVRVRPLRCVR